MKNLNTDGSRKPLSDEQIIDLYWKRDEKAIDETDFKYRPYLYTIANNILNNTLDSEECLNDTYLGTWNAIPPAKPSLFQVFLSKIMRNIAVMRYKKNSADKRIPSEMTVSLDEIEKHIAYNEFESPVEYDYNVYRLSRLLNSFLNSLSEKDRFVFICRYYCCDRISDIADMLHISERSVFRTLTALRKKLKKHLNKEGYHHA